MCIILCLLTADHVLQLDMVSGRARVVQDSEDLRSAEERDKVRLHAFLAHKLNTFYPRTFCEGT